MDLHGQIMNLPGSGGLSEIGTTQSEQLAYKRGHRDARHAAAELALVANTLADALRQIAKRDPVELALDPQWSQRVARITLTEAVRDA